MKCKYLTLVLLLFTVFATKAQNTSSSLSEIVKIKTDVKSKRVGTYDRSGGNGDLVGGIAPGKTQTIMEVKGAGIINHIWITIGPAEEKLHRNDLIIRMYWDGNSYPSVESPLGYFFGNGWNESYNYITEPLVISPGWGKSYVCYFQLPFSKGAKIEIENQSDVTLEHLYYNIDYVEMPSLSSDYGRFHAWFNREITKGKDDGENEWGTLGEAGKNPTGKENYLIADIKGKGQYIGVNYYINNPGPMWYGEGDEMVFIDGDTLPTIVGTGTEDYFNTSWCPKEYLSTPYFGYARVNGETGWMGRTHVYRYHFKDPIYYDKSLKFTIEHGHNNCLTLDLASVAYWYASTATKIPPIPNKEGRKLTPVTEARQLHIWRNEWLKNNGKTKGTWGN